MSKPNVKCPTCGAQSGEPCRALTTGRVTDVHAKRWDRLYSQMGYRWWIHGPMPHLDSASSPQTRNEPEETQQ